MRIVFFCDSLSLWPLLLRKEVNWRLAKRPLKTNERLANRQLTSLVKEATVRLSDGNTLFSARATSRMQSLL